MLLTLTTSLLALATSSTPPVSPFDEIYRNISDWNQEEVVADESYQRELQDNIFFLSSDIFPSDAIDTRASSVASSFSSSIQSGIRIDVDGTDIVLRDVPADSWFAPFVQSIAKRSLVSGYRDESGAPTGFFGPSDSVTVGQLAKVLVLAIQLDPLSCATESPSLQSHWAASFLACAQKRGWSISTIPSLDLDRPATRAEVIGTLLQALNVKPSASSSQPFADVNGSTPFASAIDQAWKNGIINGYKDAAGNLLNRFGPSDPVTRAEFAKIIVRGLEEYGR